MTSIVCLSFDFDAISGFISRGMVSPSPISRGEFGARVGAARVLSLLKKYDIASTWFIPGHTLETFPEPCQAVFDHGHEIGHHGWTHVPPAMQSAEEEEAGLLRANECIHRLTGQYAKGYRSPSWDLSEHSVALLLKHGFIYDSSMMGDDYHPYRVRQGDQISLQAPAIWGPPSQLIEMPISWSLDDYPHFEFIRTAQTILPGNMNAHHVLQNWVDDFLYLKQSLEWGILTYTFHPFVIGRGHRMIVLEKLICQLKEQGAVFMTMSQAVEAYLQHDQPVPG